MSIKYLCHSGLSDPTSSWLLHKIDQLTVLDPDMLQIFPDPAVPYIASLEELIASKSKLVMKVASTYYHAQAYDLKISFHLNTLFNSYILKQGPLPEPIILMETYRGALGELKKSVSVKQIGIIAQMWYGKMSQLTSVTVDSDALCLVRLLSWRLLSIRILCILGESIAILKKQLVVYLKLSAQCIKDELLSIDSHVQILSFISEAMLTLRDQNVCLVQMELIRLSKLSKSISPDSLMKTLERIKVALPAIIMNDIGAPHAKFFKKPSFQQSMRIPLTKPNETTVVKLTDFVDECDVARVSQGMPRSGLFTAIERFKQIRIQDARKHTSARAERLPSNASQSQHHSMDSKISRHRRLSVSRQSKNTNGHQHQPKEITLSKLKDTKFINSKRLRTLKVQKTNRQIYGSLVAFEGRNEKITPESLRNEIMMLPARLKVNLNLTLQEILTNHKYESVTRQYSQVPINQITVDEVIFSEFDLVAVNTFSDSIWHFKLTIKLINDEQLFSCENLNFLGSAHHITFDNNSCYAQQVARKNVTTSELYFELIQEKVEAPIDPLEMNLIWQALGRAVNRDSMIRICMFNKLLKSFYFWYYTTKRTPMGKIMHRRKLFPLNDSLKFSIGLQFFMRDTFTSCLKHLPTIRNKKGLKQCLYYLSDGKQFVACGVVLVEGKYYLSKLALSRDNYVKFDIDGSSVKFVSAVLLNEIKRLNELSVTTTKKHILNSYLSEFEIVQLLLKNIVQDRIPKRLIFKLIKIFSDNQAREQISIKPEEECQVEVITDPGREHQIIQNMAQFGRNVKSFSSLLQYQVGSHSYTHGFIVRATRHYLWKHSSSYYRVTVFTMIGLTLVKTIKIASLKVDVFFHPSEEINLDGLCFLQTMFCRRLAIRLPTSNDLLLTNLLFRNMSCPVAYDSNLILIKTVKKIHDQFVYVAVSFHNFLLSWQIRLYRPMQQAWYITFLNNGSLDSQVWKNMLNQLQVSRDFDWLKIGEGPTYALIESFGELTCKNLTKDGNEPPVLWIVQYHEVLYYLVAYYSDCKLELWEIGETPWDDDPSIFAEMKTKPYRITANTDLLLRINRRSVQEVKVQSKSILQSFLLEHFQEAIRSL